MAPDALVFMSPWCVSAASLLPRIYHRTDRLKHLSTIVTVELREKKNTSTQNSLWWLTNCSSQNFHRTVQPSICSQSSSCFLSSIKLMLFSLFWLFILVVKSTSIFDFQCCDRRMRLQVRNNHVKCNQSANVSWGAETFARVWSHDEAQGSCWWISWPFLIWVASLIREHSNSDA